MNLPNKLTLFRILLIPFFLYFLMLPGEYFRYISLAIFILASLTDALDGYIARKYNLITNFGKFADPLADKILVAAAIIALTGMGELSIIFTILVISREFIVTGFRILAADKRVVIAASNWGKAKTILQMITIIYILLNLPYAEILVWASAILTVVSGTDYIYKNRQLLKD